MSCLVVIWIINKFISSRLSILHSFLHFVLLLQLQDVQLFLVQLVHVGAVDEFLFLSHPLTVGKDCFFYFGEHVRIFDRRREPVLFTFDHPFHDVP